MRQQTSLAAVIYSIGILGCVASDHVQVASTDQSVLTACDPSYLQAAMGVIDPAREIVIRDLSVVEDPCRTSWTATGCGATLGKWTFGRLMASMAGETNIDSARSRQFVGKWLELWQTPQLVGLDPNPVAARTGINTAILNQWLIDSGCTAATKPSLCTTLDLRRAPFRLLAIVNRSDLDGRGYEMTAGAPGELRVVFGTFSRSSPTLAKSDAAVIFEYQFPTTFPPSWWADMFHNLSSVPFTNPGFRTQLQAITDPVVEPNAQPGRANNGSSIGQIRTNEKAFDARAPSLKQWEFRQFALPCATGLCFLAQVPVSQTPPSVANHTQALTDYLVANQNAVATSMHVVPPAMLGGSALSANGSAAHLWNTILDPNGIPGVTNEFTLVKPSDPAFSFAVRHNFAFSTCTGCHYLETSNENSNFHIGPRDVGQIAPISGFLNRTLQPSGNGPLDYLSVEDKNLDSYDTVNGTSTTFLYNEIWRRGCELGRVRQGIKDPFTTTTGHH